MVFSVNSRNKCNTIIKVWSCCNKVTDHCRMSKHNGDKSLSEASPVLCKLLRVVSCFCKFKILLDSCDCYRVICKDKVAIFVVHLSSVLNYEWHNFTPITFSTPSCLNKIAFSIFFCKLICPIKEFIPSLRSILCIKASFSSMILIPHENNCLCVCRHTIVFAIIL